MSQTKRILRVLLIFHFNSNSNSNKKGNKWNAHRQNHLHRQTLRRHTATSQLFRQPAETPLCNWSERIKCRPKSERNNENFWNSLNSIYGLRDISSSWALFCCSSRQLRVEGNDLHLRVSHSHVCVWYVCFLFSLTKKNGCISLPLFFIYQITSFALSITFRRISIGLNTFVRNRRQ